MMGRIRIAVRARDEGFSLVEIVVTIVIIGVLAAIAVPIYLSNQARAHESAIKSDLRTAATAVQVYAAENEAFPAASDWNGMVASEQGMSSGVVLTYTASETAFCIEGDHPQVEVPWSYNSDTGTIAAGSATCIGTTVEASATVEPESPSDPGQVPGTINHGHDDRRVKDAHEKDKKEKKDKGDD